MSEKVLVNTRQTDGAGMTGIKRYTDEILSRVDSDLLSRVEIPTFWKKRMRGQFWDQFVLPMRIKDLLWSPSNTGPLSYRRQVVTIHDIIPVDHPEWLPKKNALMNQVLMPNLARSVQHIITVSEFSKRRIIERFGVRAEKVTVTPLAADPRFVPLSSAEVETSKQEHDWPERYVLCVSNLEYRKNLRRLLNVWDGWSDRPRNLKLVVVGAGKADSLRDSTGNLPRDVIVMGRISDDVLPKIYACAEMFVYPSIYEGFGLPPLEAMASGTPVVTSNNTSVPEVVGDSAKMFDPFNNNEMLSAMKSIIANPQQMREMRDMGLARAKEYSWEATARMTQDVLECEAAK